MNTLLNKTHLFFFLIIPLILAVSFYKPKGTFDINIKDTYFVIRHPHLGILLSIFYLILGTIYFCLLKKGIQLSNWIVLHSHHSFYWRFDFNLVITQKEFSSFC